jgi:hypothetical protein
MNEVLRKSNMLLKLFKENLAKEFIRNEELCKDLNTLLKRYNISKGNSVVRRAHKFLGKIYNIPILIMKFQDVIIKQSFSMIIPKIQTYKPNIIPLYSLNEPISSFFKRYYVPLYYGGLPPDELLRGFERRKSTREDEVRPTGIVTYKGGWLGIRHSIYKAKYKMGLLSNREKIIKEIEAFYIPSILLHGNGNLLTESSILSISEFKNEFGGLNGGVELRDIRNVESRWSDGLTINVSFECQVLVGDKTYTLDCAMDFTVEEDGKWKMTNFIWEKQLY